MLQLTNKYEYDQCMCLAVKLYHIASTLEFLVENTSDDDLDDDAYNSLMKMSSGIEKVASEISDTANTYVYRSTTTC